MFVSLRGVWPRFPTEKNVLSRHCSIWLAVLVTLAVVLSAARGRADVVLSCGFEAAGDSWSYTSPNNPKCGVNTDAGGADYPGNVRIRGGSGSWYVGGTTNALEFSEVLLSGWKDVTVNYHVSSTSLAENGGCTPGDSVAAYVAFGEYADQKKKPVFGSVADVTLSGHGAGARWGYDSETPAVVKDAGWGGSIHPDGDGLRTVDGYSDFSIRVDDGYRSLALKLSVQNGRADDYWNIDDVTVEGVATVSRDCQWDGGDGLWSNDAENTPWASAAWDSASGNNAVFAQSGATVTIYMTTVAARSLSFDADGCFVRKDSTFSSSRLALTNGGSGGPGANTIDVSDAGHTATINVTIIANPGVGLTKTGAGTLVLSGANQYTGATVLNDGVVAVKASNNLGASEAAVAFNGGTLRFRKKLNLQSDHPFVFLSKGGTVDTQNEDCSAMTTGWNGTGSFTKIGTGTLALQGTNIAFSGMGECRTGNATAGEQRRARRLPGAGPRRRRRFGRDGHRRGLSVRRIRHADTARRGNDSRRFVDRRTRRTRSRLQLGRTVRRWRLRYGRQAGNRNRRIYARRRELRIRPSADNGRIARRVAQRFALARVERRRLGNAGRPIVDRRATTRPVRYRAFSPVLADGDVAGVYGGFEWRIYYGADAGAGLLTGG